MKFALIEGRRREAQPNLLGQCPSCERPMVAKCGEERIWHWAHQGTRTCDSWWEPETEWHRAWKGKFPIAWQEVIHPAENGEKHIADVKTDHGWVIEFQYSFIKPDERRSRNAFYPKLVWVVNGTRRKRDRAQFLRACEHGVPLRKDSPVRPGKALMLVAEENRDDISRRLHAIRQAVKHGHTAGREAHRGARQVDKTARWRALGARHGLAAALPR